MKICNMCLVEKDLSCFNFKNKSKGILIAQCKDCYRQYRKTIYENNKEAQLNRNIKYKKSLQEIVIEAKSKPCTDCGTQYNWWQMQFDHLRDKSFNISAMKQGKDRILLEIEKCEVVCANCHSDRTYKRMHCSKNSSLWTNG